MRSSPAAVAEALAAISRAIRAERQAPFLDLVLLKLASRGFIRLLSEIRKLHTLQDVLATASIGSLARIFVA